MLAQVGRDNMNTKKISYN
uniref:Uncharacterized protein n=1 Tax=Anguilla anguilla TaxID=7936 RepID=A0A0E9UR37_ANGAN